MALIKCVDCGKEISDEAINCPSCGRPIKETIVTTQLTSKNWKAVKALSWIIIIVGIVMFGNDSKEWSYMLFFFGFIGLMIGKFGAWWTNK